MAYVKATDRIVLANGDVMTLGEAIAAKRALSYLLVRRFRARYAKYELVRKASQLSQTPHE